MADYKIITSDFVKLHITTSKFEKNLCEKRFPKDILISDLKAKLELITGGNCNTMQMKVFDKKNKFICDITDNNSMLGSYPLEDDMTLHVIDNFELANALESGDVETFKYTTEEYSKKSDSVRAFLLKNKMGQYNEENLKKKEKLKAEEKQLAETTPIGSRCKVTVSNAPCRLGTVMYAGLVDTLPGYWIGVKYDEPLGKNNGTFKDKVYFNCADKYGAFVKPNDVECGDFPEEEYDLNEEI